MNSREEFTKLWQSPAFPPFPKGGKEKGFTMIELAIVMVIVGLMMAMVAINYTGWREYYRFSSAVSTLDSALRTARYRAIGRQMYLDVVFEPASNEDLKTAGWGGYPDGVGLQVRYPYQATPTDALEYRKMALVYDPAKFNVHVDTGVGMVDSSSEHYISMGSCELVGSSTDDWKWTVRFNSRGFGLRRTEFDPNRTQLPFRFLIKTPPTSTRKQGIIFSVSPLGKITRATADPSLLESE